MEENTILQGRYFVQRKFARGTFCAVHTAIDLQHPSQLKENRSGNIVDSQVCLKTIAKDAPSHELLQWESQVLQELKGKVFIPQYIDHFKYEGKDVMITELLHGDDLRETKIKQNCTPLSGMPLDVSVTFAIEMLKCIEGFHKGGFIHRDIKLANFVRRGRSEENKELCLVDFGLTKQYISSDGRMRPERPHAEFRGTTTYCSVFVHDGRDHCRRDDLISMIYSFIDFLRGELPWTHCKTDKVETRKLKEQYLTEPFFKTEGFNEKLSVILKYLHSLDFTTAPDYAFIRDQLESMKSIEPNPEEVSEVKFDWAVPPHHNRCSAILVCEIESNHSNSSGTKRKRDDLKILEDEEMEESIRCKKWCQLTEKFLKKEKLDMMSLREENKGEEIPAELVIRILNIALKYNEFFATEDLSLDDFVKTQQLVFNLQHLISNGESKS